MYFCRGNGKRQDFLLQEERRQSMKCFIYIYILRQSHMAKTIHFFANKYLTLPVPPWRGLFPPFLSIDRWRANRNIYIVTCTFFPVWLTREFKFFMGDRTLHSFHFVPTSSSELSFIFWYPRGKEFRFRFFRGQSANLLETLVDS